MSKNILLIAGVLLAAGSAAAISAPHFRGGGPMRGPDGPVFGERGGDLFGGSPVRFGERLKEMDANKDGIVTLDEFLARRDPTFARFDKNNDGVIDRAEFEAAAKESADYWIKRFIKRFDADHDGRISKDEYAKARKDRLALRGINDDGGMGAEDMRRPGIRGGIRERIRRWMGDRQPEGKEGPDGKAAKDGQEPGKDAGDRGPPGIRSLFGRAGRQFDRFDKNGDGFIDAKDMEPLAAERVALASKRFFNRFDTDGDGKVTKEEFNRFAKSRFAELDLDGDGKITDADLPPMMRGRGLLK